MDLNGKTVIVTGAARGIGLGIAQAFGREGANIVLADLGSLHSGEWTYELSSTRQFEVAVESVVEQGGKAIAIEVDVSKRDSVHHLIAQTQESFGSLDIVVNNAGVVKAGEFASYDEKSWDQTFAVNVKGTFLVSQAAVTVMLENKGGAIINISSIAGKRGYPHMSAYCASKFAIIGLTQSMAQELASSGIRVNAICPGVLSTAIWDYLSFSDRVQSLVKDELGAEAFEAYIKKNVPLGREQSAEDISQAALYLAGAENVTGIALTVAGGQVMD